MATEIEFAERRARIEELKKFEEEKQKEIEERLEIERLARIKQREDLERAKKIQIFREKCAANRRLKSVLMIQKFWRRYVKLKTLRRKIAARIIQKNYKIYRKSAEEREHRLKILSAVKIQNFYRRKKLKIQTRAALKIQFWFKKWHQIRQAKKKLENLKIDELREIKIKNFSEKVAAVKIQREWRKFALEENKVAKILGEEPKFTISKKIQSDILSTNKKTHVQEETKTTPVSFDQKRPNSKLSIASPDEKENLIQQSPEKSDQLRTEISPDAKSILFVNRNNDVIVSDPVKSTDTKNKQFQNKLKKITEDTFIVEKVQENEKTFIVRKVPEEKLSIKILESQLKINFGRSKHIPQISPENTKSEKVETIKDYELKTLRRGSFIYEIVSQIFLTPRRPICRARQLGMFFVSQCRVSDVIPKR